MNECKGGHGELEVSNNRVYLYAYIIHCRGPMGFAVGKKQKSSLLVNIKGPW